MKIIIETPKYSFFKYRKVGAEYKKDFFAPIPAIFNYGYVDGTMASDRMAEDAIVLGPRLLQGTVLDNVVKINGVVKFIDDSVKDDKKIIYLSGFKSTSILSLYFRIYTLYKIFLYLLSERRIARCRFEGIEWF
ncbi:MAG: inorganic diphosphatase [archaeon]|nr:inorganic diphosphatase [archaeon]